MGSGEEEFEDETIIEEDLYDEVSLLSTIWEESSKDLSRMGETLARLKLQKAATQQQLQQQLQLQQSEGEVDDHQQPVVLPKIPRRKRTVDVGTDDDHHQDNSEEDDGSRRPISHTTSSPSSRTHMVVSKNSTYTTTTASSGAKSIKKSTTQGAHGTHKERVSLESFLVDNHSNHSWADAPPPASPTKNKSTNKKCPSGRSAKPHESTSSSTNAGSATSPTLTSSGGRITLDCFLIDQPLPPLPPPLPSTPLAIRRRSSSSGSASGSSLGDFLEHTSPRSSALDPTATAAVAAVTLVNYLTGEEVVVPEADDEYTYVSYLSDATGLSAASCSVNSMVSAEPSLNRSDHSIKRSSSSNNSGRSRHSVALSLDLDAIAEDTDDSN